MSLLAEPRKKQKISIDPRNLQWKDDDNKVSKKMMEKMGWSDGKGLGKNNHGNVDAVKLNANHSGKGLGADKLASYDTTWIGHHDDFADLLASLNKNKPESNETEEEKKERVEKISIELSSKSVRRRIHYQKFTRMKDTSNYSEKDKAAVLGVGLGRAKQDSDEDSSDLKSEPDAVDQGNTTVSNLSVGDYFAAKMAALKAKSQVCAVAPKEKSIVVKIEVEDEKKTSVVEIEIESQEQESDKDRKKREKKLKKQQQQAANINKEAEKPIEEEMTEKQRRKMEKRLRKMQGAPEAAEVEEEPKPKKKKKRSDI